jgi:co-chaperonin GroES (HSP10)
VSEQQSNVAVALRPFWGRVTVQESPVDETETPSGLVLPLKHEGDDGLVRGIVLHCSDSSLNGLTCDAAAVLSRGTVVYYRAKAGMKISGVVILDFADVLAYEEDGPHG